LDQSVYEPTVIRLVAHHSRPHRTPPFELYEPGIVLEGMNGIFLPQLDYDPKEEKKNKAKRFLESTLNRSNKKKAQAATNTNKVNENKDRIQIEMASRFKNLFKFTRKEMEKENEKIQLRWVFEGRKKKDEGNFEIFFNDINLIEKVWEIQRSQEENRGKFVNVFDTDVVVKVGSPTGVQEHVIGKMWMTLVEIPRIQQFISRNKSRRMLQVQQKQEEEEKKKRKIKR